MRQYVPHYAKRAAALQQKKIKILQQVKEKGVIGKAKIHTRVSL